MQKIVPAFAVAAMLVATPALATDMHCNVNKNYASWLDGKKYKVYTRTSDGDPTRTNYAKRDFNTKVKDTFKGVPESVSSQDYNRFVNVKFGTERTTGTRLNVQVRPRKGAECLNAILDDQGGQMWSGAYCDTRNHQKAGRLWLFPVDHYDPENPLHWAIGSANTTTKVNHFFGVYVRENGEYVLSGVCVENK